MLSVPLQGGKVAPKLSPEEAKDEAQATVRCHVPV